VECYQKLYLIITINCILIKLCDHVYTKYLCDQNLYNGTNYRTKNNFNTRKYNIKYNKTDAINGLYLILPLIIHGTLTDNLLISYQLMFFYINLL